VEHFLPLLEDDVCFQGLADMLGAIRNGTLTSKAKPYILPSALLAVSKGDKPGIRPVAAGEVLYRLATLVGLKDVQKTAGGIMRKIGQYGVGVKGGVEIAARLISTFVSAGMGEPLAALTADLRNAFNCRKREQVLESLFQHESLSSIWRIAHWSYSEPSDLWVFSKGKIVAHLISSQGVRQGDPLGSLLFALSMHPVFKSTLEEVNAGLDNNSKDYVQAVMIHDDVNLLGRPKRIIYAYDVLSKKARLAGLDVVASKSRFLWPHSEPPDPGITELLEDRRIPKCSWANILGVPIGRDEEALSKLCMKVVNSHSCFWSCILHPDMPHQYAMLMLRYSAIPRLNFLTRTVAPSVIAKAARAFDDLVLGSALTKLRIPRDSLTPLAQKLMILPLRRGGAGLRSMFRTRHMAFLGSFARCSESLAALRFGKTQMATLDYALTLAVADALRCVRKSARPELIDRPSARLLPGRNGLGAGLKTALGFYLAHTETIDHLQKRLTKAVENTQMDSILSTCSPKEVARILSCAGKWASTCFTTLPLHSSLMLRDPDYEIAWRLRVGLPPIANAPIFCVCGGNLHEHPDHALCCEKLKKTLAYARHNMVRDAVSKVFSSVGCYTDSRCNGFEFSDGKTLDLAIFYSDQALALDVQIPCPTAGSHVEVAQSAGGAGAKSENGKKAKYEAEVNAWDGNLEFSPFIIESFGAFGATAEYVCKLAGHAAAEHSTGWRTGEAVAACVAAASIAMHRGNAMMVRACHTRALRLACGAGPGRPKGSLDKSVRRPGSGRWQRRWQVG
jgi:hypothetical protein